ncbi:trypsin-like peptidase domain-containing protein [uncultured Flavobacterium sp.]|uniref:S1C family serine protease n=1 Tax=uncultured Flavobacterium sp. TaxID=165435 RepID=UPI00261A1EE4|nr:trypsin-like peptidase domain-containing protein [uncultured Flavobacterium sp.]
MNKKIFQVIFITTLILGCNSNSNSSKSNEIELIEKDLELREKELNLRENELLLNSQILSDEKESLSSIYDKVKKGVYLIYTKNNEGISQGSAFIIDKSGIAISNYHVFKDASSAIAINDEDDEFMITEIIDYDKDKDYIIFRIGNSDNIKYLKLATNTPKIGDEVFTIGNPKGLTQTLSTGIVSSYRDGNNFIQTTAEITHGSSGAPLFNKYGEVIGITTSGIGEANLNFALNINSIGLENSLNFTENSNKSSNLSKNELIKFIKKYYETISQENWDRLNQLYSSNINRFYDKFNIISSEAIDLAKGYKSTFKILNTSYKIREETIFFNSSSKGTEISFILDYSIQRQDKSKPKNFTLNIVMVLDNKNQIKSIYENILDKK